MGRRRSQRRILKDYFYGSRGFWDLKSDQKQDLRDLSKVVTVRRQAKGLSQKDNAQRLDIPYRAFQNIEKGVYVGKHLLTIVRKEPYVIPSWMITLFIQKGWCDSIGDIFG